MDIDLSEAGLRLVGARGRVELGPALPAATVLVAGNSHRFEPARLVLDGESGVARATGGPGGVSLELTARPVEDLGDAGADPDLASVEVVATLRNDGPAVVHVDRTTALRTSALRVGESSARWRTYRNGYQSWAGTTTIGTDERDADVPTRLVRVGVTDAKHPSPTGIGHVRSDALGAVAEPVSGDALAIGFVELADAFGFVELVAPDGHVERLEVWSDRDGVPLAPGDSLVTTLHVSAAGGRDAGSRVLRSVAAAAGRAMGARGVGGHHPVGWCTWYYYFAKVTQADVRENLEVLERDGRDGPELGCEYVMVDDGHQAALGDWLRTSPERFPDGMADLARRITDAGFDAGIWWAPFLVAPESEVAQEHPEWLVRGERGRPIVGCLNPMWSLTTPMQVLDTTNPEVLAHIRRIAGVIGTGWGYSIQKLDFLYAAALPGVRHDPTVTRAQSLRAGLDAVRAGAGDDSFLLGCGCPFGPAVGVVDAMRIGADVTPYWSNAIDRIGGRGRHGLATRNAVTNVLTRAPFDDVWWLNDPDCLMVRDTDTKLTEDEVQVLATVIGITDGMVVLSDRLADVGAHRRSMVATARSLGGGTVEVPDLFERAVPELVVARHEDRVDVAVLNLGDRPRRTTVDLPRRGVQYLDGEVPEVWTGTTVLVAGGIADLGVLPAHSARVLRLPLDG